MRFDRIRVDAFGGLSGLDTGAERLGDLTVFEGRNEAGKSTFFEWLATLLYGFSPASRDTHPYAPWDGANPEGSAHIRLTDGATVEVRRRLLSSPAGSLVVGDAVEDLRNRPLPFVDHVPATIFRQVFALRLSELASLEGSGWEAVQDRLLGAFGANDLRSAREVADAIEAEAGRLWRPNRKGNQEIRELDERRTALRYRRTEAAREEQAIRDATDHLAATRLRLDQARTERVEARAFVDRYRALLPIRDQLRRIHGLLEDAGDQDLLSSLPSNPAQALTELRQRAEDLNRRIRDLERDQAQPSEAVRAWDVHAQAILGSEAEIQSFLRRAASGERVLLRRTQLEQEVRDLRRRLDTGVLRALGRSLDDELEEALTTFQVARLREAIDRLDAVRRVAPPLPPEEPPLGSGEPPAGQDPRVVPGLIVGGAILMAAAWLSGLGALTFIPGALVLGAGLARLQASHGAAAAGEAARLVAEEQRTRMAARVEAHRSELADAEGRIVALMEPLSPDFTLEELFSDLPAELTRFQDWIRDARDRAVELERTGSELDALGVEAKRLAQLDPELPGDPAGLAHDLPALLRRANQRREAATAGRRELARLEEHLETARDDRDAVHRQLSGLSRSLEAIGDGDLEAGVSRATERLQARDRAHQLLDELERAHPDLAEIRGRIQEAEERGEHWAVDEDALSRRKAMELGLTDEIEELGSRARGLEKEIEHLRDRTLVDDLDGQLEELDDARERLVRRRDRLWVMSRIIRDAERILREEHQPALLRRAGTLLYRLTGGRYDRILLGGRDGRGFRVRGAATPDALEVAHPLSTGTREQIYLALRLAILDHLDRAGEKLPLVLDEVFVNWDPERRAAGIELIRELSASRQVFFFSCHPEVVAEITATGARRVLLDRS